MIKKKNLRIDIEALRGLSVILVILYHFKLSNLDYQIIKGGFIGVDIFLYNDVQTWLYHYQEDE